MLLRAGREDRMVSSHYLAGRPARPSGLKRFLNQQMLPLAIDGAAQLDRGLVCAGRQIRANPALFVGLLLAVGVLLVAPRVAARRS
jgi:hypothetical protein